MKSVPKLIKRFVGILMLSSLVILFMNFIIIAIITATQAPNGSPWTTAEQAAESMVKSEQGYKMSDEMIEELNAQNVWAVYIDNATGECVWHSDNLPDTVPLKYTASDIANTTRGYIDGYPTCFQHSVFCFDFLPLLPIDRPDSTPCPFVRCSEKCFHICKPKVFHPSSHILLVPLFSYCIANAFVSISKLSDFIFHLDY